MSDYGGAGCCRCCFSFLLTSGLTALFLWLSLHTSKPVCSIQDFYVSAVNKTLNSTSNHSIFFDLKLENQNVDKGVYYDAINLTFYYGPNLSLPIANYTVSGFHQGQKKHTHRKDLVDARGVPWDDVFRGVSNESVAVFRVDLATTVRFKIISWKTKRHKLDLKSNVVVDDSGKKVEKKGIKLNNGGQELGCYLARLRAVVIVSVLVLVL